MNVVNKTSRVLGIAFLLQFVTSFSSGVFLKPALFVTGNINESIPFFLYVPHVPFEFLVGVWTLVKGINDAPEIKLQLASTPAGD
jgi:hypothetical protein